MSRFTRLRDVNCQSHHSLHASTELAPDKTLELAVFLGILQEDRITNGYRRLHVAWDAML
jgi:hypothetical protein